MPTGACHLDSLRVTKNGREPSASLCPWLCHSAYMLHRLHLLHRPARLSTTRRMFVSSCLCRRPPPSRSGRVARSECDLVLPCDYQYWLYYCQPPQVHGRLHDCRDAALNGSLSQFLRPQPTALLQGWEGDAPPPAHTPVRPLDQGGRMASDFFFPGAPVSGV